MSVNLDLRKMLWEVDEWTKRNFPNAKPYQPLLGAVEELGELTHAHLKMEQNIRGTFTEHFQAKKDAVGDVVIYLIHYCRLNGFDFEDALQKAWNVVRERNWRDNPLTGRSGNISEFVRQEYEQAISQRGDMLSLTVDETL